MVVRTMSKASYLDLNPRATLYDLGQDLILNCQLRSGKLLTDLQKQYALNELLNPCNTAK